MIRGRWERMQVSQIAGRERAGSSSWQSLARGSGAIETDYLNGEIALLGRLHGVRVPVNAQLCELADRVAAAGGSPGQLPAEEVLAAPCGPAGEPSGRPRAGGAPAPPRPTAPESFVGGAGGGTGPATPSHSP